ncbi:MAG: hypothetical protein ACI4F5_04050 [Acutalibacteraceae bacterium]
MSSDHVRFSPQVPLEAALAFVANICDHCGSSSPAKPLSGAEVNTMIITRAQAKVRLKK